MVTSPTLACFGADMPHLPLAAMLVEAAGSVGRMHGKNYLAAQHARLLKRRGMGRAQVAVAHTILVSAYWMLDRRRLVSMRGLTRPDARRCHPAKALRYQPPRNRRYATWQTTGTLDSKVVDLSNQLAGFR
jgi:hypothetical protein